MTAIQIILNPNAAGGRAMHLWDALEHDMRDLLGELVLAITQHPDEVLQHLRDAYVSGLRQVVSIGGDGTNHALINALIALKRDHPDAPMMDYGMLPVGTGRDWARSRGIPMDFMQAVEWITRTTPRPTDIGQVTIETGTPDEKQVYFLNIASVGLGGDVDARVNRVMQRRPWTFLKATVESILMYQPKHMRITLDGEMWYDDKALLAVVANGTTFGHGMKIAPGAKADDGLFDVLVIADLPKLRVLTALGNVYTGTHLKHTGVFHQRARQVTIVSEDGPLELDLDGEHATGNHLAFSVQPGLLNLY